MEYYGYLGCSNLIILGGKSLKRISIFARQTNLKFMRRTSVR